MGERIVLQDTTESCMCALYDKGEETYEVQRTVYPGENR